MKIAIPLTGGKLSEHFGHCEQFMIADVDTDTNTVTNKVLLTPPPHEPGVLPSWLASLNVDCLIAAGIGQRAVQLFAQNNITVTVGVRPDEPDNLITQYLNQTLESDKNICDH